MHSVFWIVGTLAVFVLAMSYYGSLATTNIPYLAIPYTPKDFGWAFEEVTFPSEDGLKLSGWFIPSNPPSSSTLVMLHGMGSNHGDNLLNTACLVRENRWNLFYFTFRGHGESEGNLTSLGPLEMRDLAGALKYLKDNKSQATKHLGIYGNSLGAAVAIVGAAKFPELEAVAAESSFATIAKTIKHFGWIYHGIPYYPFVPLANFFTMCRLRLRIGLFDPVKAISKIAPRPVFLIQGGRDLRIPMEDFQSLWAAAREPKEQLIVPGADHGDPWMVDKETYEKRLVNFFRKALP